jgi:hypothetical protein
VVGGIPVGEEIIAVAERRQTAGHE